MVLTKQRGIIWMGPTGCGKTGLATAFLLQAIDRGYRGYFVTFPELLQELFQSLADRTEGKVLKRYLSYDCLVIDEVGYVEVEPAQVGQFFTLMHKRIKKLDNAHVRFWFAEHFADVLGLQKPKASKSDVKERTTTTDGDDKAKQADGLKPLKFYLVIDTAATSQVN
jgi:hypothetical protein